MTKNCPGCGSPPATHDGTIDGFRNWSYMCGATEWTPEHCPPTRRCFEESTQCLRRQIAHTDLCLMEERTMTVILGAHLSQVKAENEKLRTAIRQLRAGLHNLANACANDDLWDNEKAIERADAVLDSTRQAAKALTEAVAEGKKQA